MPPSCSSIKYSRILSSRSLDQMGPSGVDHSAGQGADSGSNRASCTSPATRPRTSGVSVAVPAGNKPASTSDQRTPGTSSDRYSHTKRPRHESFSRLPTTRAPRVTASNRTPTVFVRDHFFIRKTLCLWIRLPHPACWAATQARDVLGVLSLFGSNHREVLVFQSGGRLDRPEQRLFE